MSLKSPDVLAMPAGTVYNEKDVLQQISAKQLDALIATGVFEREYWLFNDSGDKVIFQKYEDIPFDDMIETPFGEEWYVAPTDEPDVMLRKVK